MSKESSILFLSYWYPNKINRIFPVFIKKHAQSISLQNKVIVLSLSIIKEPRLYKKSVEILTDEYGIETHQVYLASHFYKFIYILLPLQYFVLRNYINKKLVPAHKFEVIHTNILFPCAIVGSWLAGHFRFKHVITEHWSRLDSFFGSNIYRSFGRKTLKNADAITCVSDLLKNTLTKYTDNKTIRIVPNVIDENEFYIDPEIPQNKTLTFFAAANWTPPKYPFDFLDALEELWKEKRIGTFELIMAGNGSQLEDVKKRNYSFKIHYPGILNSRELRTALNQSHLFLHGSRYETFSTIIAEALMCGLPSVVSPVGIAHEVINSENGFIALNTRADWKNKIEMCLSTKYDRTKIAAQLIGKYDLITIGNKFSEVYKSLK